MFQLLKAFFPCNHPADQLRVVRDEARAEVDGEFENVTYQFECAQCGKDVNIEYVRVTGGPAKFLQRDFGGSQGVESVVHNIARGGLRLPMQHGQHGD